MKDLLKALALAPFVIPYRMVIALARGLGAGSAEFTCWILGCDWYKGMCVRCGDVPGGHEI